MKNITNKFLVWLLVVAGTFTGCDEFLEEEVRGRISPSNFFNNDTDAELAVNGVYRLLHRRGIYGQRGLDDYIVYGTDVVEPTRNTPSTAAISSYLIAEGVSDGNSTWSELYEVVNASTEFLTYIEGNTKITEPTRNEVVGELLFLRALAYYHLTNLWGDVPYIRELMDPVEAGKLPRFDKVQIRTDMKNDLERAISLMSDLHPDELASKATKWAGFALKAKYHLIDKEWQLAKDACDSIIEKSHHTLLPNFEDIFDKTDPANTITNEHIFVVDYATDVVSTWKTSAFNPRLRDEPRQRNARPGGPGTPKNWELLEAALEEQGEAMNGFGAAAPMRNLARQSNWQAGDLRYDVTIVREYVGFNLNNAYFRKMWNLNNDESPRQNHHENHSVFRLADIYLMAAEAENELNGPTNAYPYVNRVRERAFEPDQPWSGMSQTEFREAMYDERKFELCAEGHRKTDLIRWGILLDVVQNELHRPFNNAPTNIDPRHVLLPIPQAQLILNPALLDSDPTNNGYR